MRDSPGIDCRRGLTVPITYDTLDEAELINIVNEKLVKSFLSWLQASTLLRGMLIGSSFAAVVIVVV